jgi:membrane protease YdiL (CAAX protease family)
MTTTAAVAHPSLASRHPLILFFALTYAVSWSFWLLAAQVGGTLHTVLLVAGGFGPATAAAVTVRLSGGSLREWARGIVRWRVGFRYYLYALGLPLLIMLCTNLALGALGQQLTWSSLLDRAPAYLQTFLVTAVIFGGQEEPGWRGFALPRLQSRYSPMIATMILGLAWGVWHIPLYGPTGFVVPLVLAVFYTWLYNKTQSVLLCILLHASFTAAQDHLLLTRDSPVVDGVLLGSYLLAAIVIIVISRGRLGYTRHEAATEKDRER